MIYLYIKQHTVTGKKYFGRTVKNPYTYGGSGVYWRRHIAKHGPELVETVEVFSFECQETCTEFALKFSTDNNIVESNEWANQIPEDGRKVGIIHSRHTKQAIGNAHRGASQPWARKALDDINLRRASGESIHPCTSRWRVTHPSGDVEIVDNLKEFCRRHKLSAGNFTTFGRTKGYTVEKVGLVKHLQN